MALTGCVAAGWVVPRAVTAKTVASSVARPVSQSAAASSPCPVAPKLNRRAKLRQLVVVGFRTESPAELKKVANTGVGGFMLLGNFATQAAISTEVVPRIAAIKSGITATSPTQPWIAVDEEGGRVQRLVGLGRVPSARLLAKQAPEAITKTVAAHSAGVRALGFNLNFAPVLDLDNRVDGVIASRSFSSDATVAWNSASAYAVGLTSQNIVPVYKHFPGHGTANGDSHKVLPTTKSLATLKAGELTLFKKAIDQQPGQQTLMIMVGHLIVPGLSTSKTTATSADPATYQLLRSMGFTGVAITDALDMSALSGIGTIGQRGAAAMIAGADVVLLTTVAQLEDTVDELDAAATDGRLSIARIDEAWQRVWCHKVSLAR